MRQMIEGKLSEEHEPRNIQVDVIESAEGPVIKLRDEEGIILDIPPEEELPESGSGSELSDREGDLRVERERTDDDREAGLEGELESAQARTGELELELECTKGEKEHAVAENIGLLEEVSQLRERLQKEKDKYATLWRMNCEQLIEHDSAISVREEESERLRARVAELELGGGLPARTEHCRDGED